MRINEAMKKTTTTRTTTRTHHSKTFLGKSMTFGLLIGAVLICQTFANHHQLHPHYQQVSLPVQLSNGNNLNQHGYRIPQQMPMYATRVVRQQQQQQQQIQQQQNWPIQPNHEQYQQVLMPSWQNQISSPLINNIQPLPSHIENYSLHPTQFANRKGGPLDNIMTRAKSWLPGNSNQPINHEPKMRESNRLPKPPTYPLYDLPSIGMATPPPAPLMHPMAQMPSNMYSNYEEAPLSRGGPYASASENYAVHAQSGSNGQKRIKKPHSPPQLPRNRSPLSKIRNGLSSFRNKKRPGPPPSRRHHGPPPQPQKVNRQRPGAPQGNRGHHHHHHGPPQSQPKNSYRPFRPHAGGAQNEGFDHPMASNVHPVNSPALGRPLDYDEYMKRPSHSFTDDPWNFDPFAAQMNQGMQTYAMKYNYDPLGMNNLDTAANSHLDPAKLSYPGDYFNREVKDSISSTTSQIGGWDKPITGYNGYMDNSKLNKDKYNDDGFDRPGPAPNRYDRDDLSQQQQPNGQINDELIGGRKGDSYHSGSNSNSRINSFNVFEQGEGDNNGGGHVGPTATIDLDTLNPPAEDSKIEFTIETSLNDKNNYGNGHGHGNNPPLSDQYSPYGGSPLGEPIGPPFSSDPEIDGDRDRDDPQGQPYGLEEQAQYQGSQRSYARTSDYGMRNVRTLPKFQTYPPQLPLAPGTVTLPSGGQTYSFQASSLRQQPMNRRLMQHQQQQQHHHHHQSQLGNQRSFQGYPSNNNLMIVPSSSPNMLLNVNTLNSNSQADMYGQGSNIVETIVRAPKSVIEIESHGNDHQSEGMKIFRDIIKSNSNNNNHNNNINNSNINKAKARQSLIKALTAD